MVCYLRIWDFSSPDIISSWHKICDDLILLIDTSRPSSSDTDRGMENFTAGATLSDINFNQDGTDYYRHTDVRPASIAEARQQEDVQYRSWSEQFVVNYSLFTDDFLRKLANIAGSRYIVDNNGFKYWRIRLLDDETRTQRTPLVVPIENSPQAGPSAQDTEQMRPDTSSALVVSSDPVIAPDPNSSTGNEHSGLSASTNLQKEFEHVTLAVSARSTGSGVDSKIAEHEEELAEGYECNGVRGCIPQDDNRDSFIEMMALSYIPPY